MDVRANTLAWIITTLGRGGTRYFDFATCVPNDILSASAIKWKFERNMESIGTENKIAGKRDNALFESYPRINFSSLKVRIKFLVRRENSCVKRRLANWYRQFFMAKFPTSSLTCTLAQFTRPDVQRPGVVLSFASQHFALGHKKGAHSVH